MKKKFKFRILISLVLFLLFTFGAYEAIKFGPKIAAWLNPGRASLTCTGSGDSSCVSITGSGDNNPIIYTAGGSGDNGNTGKGGGIIYDGGGSGGVISGGQQQPKYPASAPAPDPAPALIPISAPDSTSVEIIIKTFDSIKKIVNTPAGSVATKTISTAGAVVATAEVASLAVFSPFEIYLSLARLFGLFFAGLGLKKRVKPWGVVYDAVTKQPIDPAYVVLKDPQGRTLASAITDLDGRYGFWIGPGIYQISANKTNYAFPSEKLINKDGDEFYDDLYFGEKIEIKEDGEAIIKNIPMDPLKFDWNEFIKKDKRLMRFFSKLDLRLRLIFDWLFAIGFAFAIVAYFSAPYPYNMIILIVYFAVLFLRIIGVRPKAFGRIINEKDGSPMSFALLRITFPGTNIEVARRVADKYGRYYCLVPPGKYYAQIEKKKLDGSYLKVFSSEIIVSKKGIIKNNFRI